MPRIQLAFAACVLGATAGHTWEYRLERIPVSGIEYVRCGAASSVAVDPAGDVVVGGQIFDCGDSLNKYAYTPTVVKLAGSDGHEVWRRLGFEDTFGDCLRGAPTLAIGADGAPVVIGSTNDCFAGYEGIVTKLAPATGVSLWLRYFPEHWPATGGLDPNGDVFVGGGGAASKLDGATGGTLWSVPIAGNVFAATPDSSGSLLVAFDDQTGSYRVARLDGATGAELWNVRVEDSTRPQVALHPRPDGRVIVSGTRSLVELGTDGGTAWSTTLPVGEILGVEDRVDGHVLVGGTFIGGGALLSHLSYGFEQSSHIVANGPDARGIWRMGFDSGGDALFAGSGSTAPIGGAALLRKVNGESLDPVWSSAVDFGALDGRPTETWPRAVTTDLAGNVLVAGDAFAILPDVPDLREGEGVFAVMKRTGTTGGSYPCGNGDGDPGEACDDGNLVDGDGCDVTCRPSGCPSGRVSGDEECDDGNAIDGDGCSAACRLEPV
jgi:cysteine-rich repeat protein